MPSLIDLLVLSGIGCIALFPYALQYLRKLPARPAPTPAVANHTQWQTHWTNTLIQLLNELDESGDPEAVALTRDLMWQILGGGERKPATHGGVN